MNKCCKLTVCRHLSAETNRGQLQNFTDEVMVLQYEVGAMPRYCILSSLLVEICQCGITSYYLMHWRNSPYPTILLFK